MSKTSFLAWLRGPADDVVAYRDDGEAISRREFVKDVCVAARALVGFDGQLIAIDDGQPYRFTVLLCAVVWSGCTPVLFPGRGAQFEALQASYDAVLIDAVDAPNTYPKTVLIVKSDAEPRSLEGLKTPHANHPIKLFTSG